MLTPLLTRKCLKIMLAAALGATAVADAAPVISRLTPPSELFSSGNPSPVIARFLPGQRFDLQATVQPDAGKTITAFRFTVDGIDLTPAAGTTSSVTTGLVSNLPAGTAVVSQRTYSNLTPGLHILKVTATQSSCRSGKSVALPDVYPVSGSAGPGRHPSDRGTND